MKKTLIILVASSLFFGLACNKKEQTAVSDTAQSVTEAVSDDWDKSVVNGLLQYVPAETSMVYASTRAIDLNHPMMTFYLDKIDKLMGGLVMDSQSHNDIEGVAVNHFYAALSDVASKHDVVLPEWGLDAHGKTDMVFYTTDKHMVAKVTLVDGKKTSGKVFELFSESEGVSVQDIKVGEEDWVLIGEQDSHVLQVALHFAPKELTMSLVLNTTEDLNYLNAMLKPVATPLSKDALGNVGEHTAGLGFIDNVKLVAQAFNKSSDLGKLLRIDDELSSEICTSELKSMAEGFPRIVFNTTLHADEIHLNTLLKVKNVGIISDLKSLLGKHIPIATAKPTLSVSASLNVAKSIKVFAKWANAIAMAPYSCSGLSFINDAATTIATIPVITGGPQFGFLSSTTGLGLSIEAYQMVDDKMNITASAYIIGSELLGAATFSKSMIGSDVKQLDDLKLGKDVVSTMDFSDIADTSLVLQTMFTDNGILLTTGKDVDIVALSKIDAVTSQDLLTINFTYKVSFSEEQFKMDLVQNIRINAVEDGIHMLSIMKF